MDTPRPLPDPELPSPSAPCVPVLRSRLESFAGWLMLLPLLAGALAIVGSGSGHAAWLGIFLAAFCWPVGLILGLIGATRTHRLRRAAPSERTTPSSLPAGLARLFCPDYRFAWWCLLMALPLRWAVSFLSSFLPQGFGDLPQVLPHLGWVLLWAYSLLLSWRADTELPCLARRFPLRTVLTGAVMALLAAGIGPFRFP
jgi:hypothetical protein